MKGYKYLFLSFILLYFSCEEPCKTYVKKITSEVSSIMGDVNGPTETYTGSTGSILVYDSMYFKPDTSFVNPNDPCSEGIERISLTLYGRMLPKEIKYLVSANRDLYVTIGNPDSCGSTFYLHVDSLNWYPRIDSLVLNNNKYYDVYHRTLVNGNSNCCNEIYYNTQYGVVGINWLGEWYNVGTDTVAYIIY